jgi:hypothetical protein
MAGAMLLLPKLKLLPHLNGLRNNYLPFVTKPGIVRAFSWRVPSRHNHKHLLK